MCLRPVISQDNVNWKRKIDVTGSTLDTFVISRFRLFLSRCSSLATGGGAASLESVGSQIEGLIDKYLINPLDDQDQSIA